MPIDESGGVRATSSEVSITSVWADSVRGAVDEALQNLGTAVAACPSDRWQAPMWRVDVSEIVGDVRDRDGRVITDADERAELVQRWSTPWSVAWHALEVVDYDLTGELGAWSPPPPFAGKPHWLTFTSLPSGWTPAEIIAYVGYCRRRVEEVFGTLTEDRGRTPLPPAHRCSGRPYAWLVTSLIAHTAAHATQIRQAATASRSSSGPD